MSKNILKANATLLNPAKTSHRELEQQRRAALTELERYGTDDRHGKLWFAKVEEAIRRRAAGHVEWLLRIAALFQEDDDPLAERYYKRALEVSAHLTPNDSQRLASGFASVAECQQSKRLNERKSSTSNDRVIIPVSAMWP